MKFTKIFIETNNQKYPVIIGKNILRKTNFFLKHIFSNTKKVAIITDKKLPPSILKTIKFSLKNYKLFIYKLPSGERTKNIKYANSLISKILKENFNRTDCIVALGGGVIGDLSGLVASLVKRGIRFVNIPTTLLSQVDASIGGKTAINSAQGKNLIGSFYHPNLILTDISVIDSLPPREIICGYAEILKYSLILDKKFFIWLNNNGKELIYKKKHYLLEKAIITSCKIKSQIVKKDESEKNLRMILNFGHTFGHAFESVRKFSKKLNHGEAVLLGMFIANQFAFKKKILNSNDFELIKKHYLNLDLLINIQKKIRKSHVSKIISFMKSDKKNFDSKINHVLLKRIGKALKPKDFLHPK